MESRRRRQIKFRRRYLLGKSIGNKSRDGRIYSAASHNQYDVAFQGNICSADVRVYGKSSFKVGDKAIWKWRLSIYDGGSLDE